MHLTARSLAGSALSATGSECLRVTFIPPRAPRPASRAQVAVQADGQQTGLTSNSSLLGPQLNSGGGSSSSSSSLGPKLSTGAPTISIDDVPLESGMNVDYSNLRDLLKESKWREAEDETRAKLIEAAGPGAQKRNWVYWSEIKTIPAEDLRTMDALWSASSGGKFGYRVQRELWIQNRRQWPRFFKAIDWVQGENNVYRKWPSEFKYESNAPKGHLPLTNALRGTRLFEAIMEHPAFAEKKGATPGGGSTNGPSWL